MSGNVVLTLEAEFASFWQMLSRHIPQEEEAQVRRCFFAGAGSALMLLASGAEPAALHEELRRQHAALLEWLL